MYWPSRPDFSVDVPLAAWWYTNLEPTGDDKTATANVCATTGTAIICRIQKILRDGLKPPWQGFSGKVYQSRPLVTGMLWDETFEALWAYACRLADISDADLRSFAAAACSVPSLMGASPFFRADFLEFSAEVRPYQGRNARTTLLEFALEGVFMSCIRARIQRGEPKPAWMVRDDGQLLTSNMFTVYAIWFAYYHEVLEDLGDVRGPRLVPAMLGEVPEREIRLSAFEASTAMYVLGPTGTMEGATYREPTTPTLNLLPRVGINPIYTQADLARFAVARPLCALARSLAYPSLLEPDARRELETLRRYHPAFANVKGGQSFLDLLDNASLKSPTLAQRLQSAEERNRQEQAAIARAQHAVTTLRTNIAGDDAAFAREAEATRARARAQAQRMLEDRDRDRNAADAAWANSARSASSGSGAATLAGLVLVGIALMMNDKGRSL